MINNIFEIEWLMLEEDIKKDLLTVTRCGIIPIEFTSAYIFPMNLDSFVGVSIQSIFTVITLCNILLTIVCNIVLKYKNYKFDKIKLIKNKT